MSFAWEDFNTLAFELVNTSEDSAVPEAAIRASLSRSYYAVFGVAGEVLRERGVGVPRKSAHASVRNALACSPDEVDRKIARALSRLFRTRAEADYHASPNLPLTRELAEEAQMFAHAALTALSRGRSTEAGEPDASAEPATSQDRP